MISLHARVAGREREPHDYRPSRQKESQHCSARSSDAGENSCCVLLTAPQSVLKGRLLANGYPHQFNRVTLRRLTTSVVDRRRTDLPMPRKFLYYG